LAVAFAPVAHFPADPGHDPAASIEQEMQLPYTPDSPERQNETTSPQIMKLAATGSASVDSMAGRVLISGRQEQPWHPQGSFLRQ
jgi:hypothetical protein